MTKSSHKTRLLDPRQRALAHRARARLDRCFSSRISLDELAESFDISLRRLRDLFTQEFGCSPSNYVLSLRVERAKQLLRKGFPIKEVAVEAGFFDQAHLTKHFKRIAGTTPAKFFRKG